VVVSSAYDNALASWKKQALLTLLITLGITSAAGVVAFRSVRLLNALAEHNSALLHLAMTDVLTGVSNRRHFVNVLEHEFVRARRYGSPLSVLAFDLDFFKRINDGYGHAVGDEALTNFARVAKQGLRDMDLLGRLGGEEFSILLPNTTMTEALVVAERVRDGVTQISIPTDNGTLKFTTSVGVAEVRQTDTSVDDLLRRADAALYDAKAAGRNRVATESAA
jgi:diguanylate cyclase (GGDEF)-like protein